MLAKEAVMEKNGERLDWNHSRRGFLQAAGVSLPALSVLLREGAAAASPDVAASVQDVVARELSDPSLGDLTLDEVQRTGHEVHYEEIAHLYSGPMSLAPVI